MPEPVTCFGSWSVFGFLLDPGSPIFAPMLKKAYLHIIKSLAGPFFFSILTIMFIFLLQFLMKYLDKLAGKGLSLGVISELIVLNLAWMLVLAVPMGVLISTLMVFGKLSGDHEITTLKAAGVSPLKLMMPVIFLGALVAGVMFWFNDYILPDANYKAKTLFRDIRNKKPTFEIEAGRFSDLFSGYSIHARETNQETGILTGVTIFDYSNSSRQQVITARHAHFTYSPDLRYMIMTLNDGEINEIDYLSFSDYRKITFKTQKVLFDASGFGFERSSEGSFARGYREMSIATMRQVNDSIFSLISKSSLRASDYFEQSLRSAESFEPTGVSGSEISVRKDSSGFRYRIQSASDGTYRLLEGDTMSVVLSGLSLQEKRDVLFNAQNDQVRLRNYLESETASRSSLMEDINNYLVEIHKKFALPVACLMFVLVGVPLGIQSKRGGIGAGAGLSLAFFMVYWIFLLGGEKLADRGIVPPALAMWSANAVVLILGIWLTVKMMRESEWAAVPAWTWLVDKAGILKEKLKKKPAGESR